MEVGIGGSTTVLIVAERIKAKSDAALRCSMVPLIPLLTEKGLKLQSSHEISSTFRFQPNER